MFSDEMQVITVVTKTGQSIILNVEKITALSRNDRDKTATDIFITATDKLTVIDELKTIIEKVNKPYSLSKVPVA